MIDKMEKTYDRHVRAEEISNRLFGRLETQRKRFWEIVGDPPLLKPIRKIVDSPWSLSAVSVVLALSFVWLASVMAHAVGLLAIGLCVLFIISVATRQDERLHRMNRSAMRRFKDRYFFERGPGTAHERYHGNG